MYHQSGFPWCACIYSIRLLLWYWLYAYPYDKPEWYDAKAHQNTIKRTPLAYPFQCTVTVIRDKHLFAINWVSGSKHEKHRTNNALSIRSGILYLLCIHTVYSVIHERNLVFPCWDTVMSSSANVFIWCIHQYHPGLLHSDDTSATKWPLSVWV